MYRYTSENDLRIAYARFFTQANIVEKLAGSDLSVGTIVIGGVSHYLTIAADGTLTLTGDATTWDDFSISLTTGRQGVASKPDYDFTNLGLLFPNNDATEIAYVIAQMPHRKKMGSAIYYHVHYIQDQATQPTFKLDYKFYNNNSLVPATWTTISTADSSKGLFTWTSGSLLQIATFAAIAAPSSETVSANIDARFYRDDADATGDVLGKYLDFHYEIDSLGSSGEYTK